LSPGDLLLLVRIKTRAIKSFARRLMVWFAPGKRGNLVGTFDDGADYQLDCQVASAPQNSSDDTLGFVIVLKRTQTAWRAVSLIPHLDANRSGGTKNITVGGTNGDRLS